MTHLYTWSDYNGGGFRQKQYDSYEDYLAHQKSKLRHIHPDWLASYDARYRTVLRERLTQDGCVKPGSSVLCLAARIGTEVKSFLDLGCFAVGLDIQPGTENQYVVYGDFHNIQFADDSADIVFTNSLDHMFDFARLIAEIKRVLKPNGLFILEIFRGEEEGSSPGYHESTIWKNAAMPINMFAETGFEVLVREPFAFPWAGWHVLFRLRNGAR